MNHQKPSPSAFTLVELLLSTAVISLLLLLLTGIVNQTANTWRYTTSKVEQFRSSKSAFESITRRLSQATLNTYWDYQYKSDGKTPEKYVRQSDLRFISGSAEDLTAASAKDRPGHAVFFQAPLGFVDDPNFSGLSNLLNTWGYYVEFNSDKSLRPDFLNNLNPPIPERYRFRLMELMQPANNLSIYPLTATANYKKRDWFTKALPTIPPATTVSPVHVLAENVITLILLPKLAVEEDKTASKPLAPGYSYDSTAENPDPAINPKNQLPPIVQVTLIALDERSAARMANGSTAPDLGLDKIFKADGTNGAAQYTADLATLEASLAGKSIAYRVFTTNVSIRGAKWSRN